MEKKTPKGLKVAIIISIGLIAAIAIGYIAFLSDSEDNDSTVNGLDDQQSDNVQSIGSNTNPNSENDLDNQNSSDDDNDSVVRDTSLREIIGNILDVGVVSGMSAIFIEDTNDAISIRFTSKYTGQVTTLVTYFQRQGSGTPTLEVGLQQDNGSGTPSGSWINAGSFGVAQLKGDGFLTVNFDEPADVNEGDVYHIVIKMTPSQDDNQGISKIPMIVYGTKQPYQPLNEERLDIVWPDSAINTIYYDGQRWRETNNWPVFVVKFADGKSQGQPYSLAAPWVIFGPRHVGQAFVPQGSYALEKFGFVVNTKGDSQDDLHYQIRNSQDDVILEGIFAEKGLLGKNKQWVEVDLLSSLELKKGELYRIVLLSPKTAEPNSYQVYGHEFTYDKGIGYGGEVQMLTASYSSGRNWERWIDADAIFRLTVMSTANQTSTSHGN